MYCAGYYISCPCLLCINLSAVLDTELLSWSIFFSISSTLYFFFHSFSIVFYLNISFLSFIELDVFPKIAKNMTSTQTLPFPALFQADAGTSFVKPSLDRLSGSHSTVCTLVAVQYYLPILQTVSFLREGTSNLEPQLVLSKYTLEGEMEDKKKKKKE